MDVREKGARPGPGAEEAAERPAWLDRLNEFGERHARPIIIASTLLVIVTVLIVADVVYKRTIGPKVERERAAATTSKQLQELKQKYHSVPGEIPLIVLDLGHKLYQENKLEEALKEYEEFIATWPSHPLKETAVRAKQKIDEDLKFVEGSKEAVMRQGDLEAHPLTASKLAEGTRKLREELRDLKGKEDAESKERAARIAAELDRRAASPLAIGPVREPNPQLVLKVGKDRTIKIELFEDEAPNSVAQIVDLAKKKYFDGLKFSVSEDQLKLAAKEKDPATGTLSPEGSEADGEAGTVVLVKRPDGSGNLPAEFAILLKERPLTGETVIGQVAENGLFFARQVKADDAIESATVEKLRDHDYAPKLAPEKK